VAARGGGKLCLFPLPSSPGLLIPLCLFLLFSIFVSVLEVGYIVHLHLPLPLLIRYLITSISLCTTCHSSSPLLMHPTRHSSASMDYTYRHSLIYGLTQQFLNSLVHHFPLPPSFLPLHNRYPFLPTETVKSRYDVAFLYTSLTERCNRVFFCSFSLVIISIIFPIVTTKFSWQYEHLQISHPRN
jgi:hypothetical protein